MQRLFVSCAALIALGLSACAFQDGDPWGRLDLSMAARFAPSADRLDGTRLITANDYAIELSLVELELCHVELAFGSGASSGVGFDPATPPEGYSLCHGGHCHSDDGRLVDYETIAAELGASSDSATTTLSLPIERVVSLGATLSDTSPESCPNDCALEQGVAQSAAVHLEGMHLAGRAFDRRSGDNARLPAEGVPFDFEIVLGIPITTTLAANVGKGEPLRLGVELTLDLPSSLFDGVDWANAFLEPAELDPTNPVALALLDAVQERATLSADISR